VCALAFRCASAMGNEWCAVHNSTTKCGPCTYAHAQKNTAVRVRYNHSVNPTPTPTCCACASWALLRPIVVLVPSHVCKKGTVHKKGRLTVSELVTACCSACGEVQAETSLAEARRTCRYVLERRYKQNVRCHDLEQRATRVPSSTKLNRLHDLHHVAMLQCALSTGHCMPPCSTFLATSLSFVW